jgi:hypothetical protein
VAEPHGSPEFYVRDLPKGFCYAKTSLRTELFQVLICKQRQERFVLVT